MLYKLHFSDDAKTHAQILVQDHTRGRVGIWTRYSFCALTGLRLLLSCAACLPNRWTTLGGQRTRFYLFGTHLTVFSTNTGAGVDRTSYYNGIILYRGICAGLLFLQSLPGVLRHEGLIVHQRHAA